MLIHRYIIIFVLTINISWGQTTFQGMNPNIGVIGDFSYQIHSNDVDLDRGFQFSEVEISFRMVLDPYARADFFIAVVPPEEAVELEEGFITLLSLPYSFQARVGHFRPSFGKFNLTHPPETRLATLPLFLGNFFGEEGLAATGVSLSALIPNPWDIYIEWNIDILNGEELASFKDNAPEDFLYLLHLKNFFDVSENHSIEFGLSTMMTKSDASGHETRLYGADFIYRWKPLIFGRYRSFTLQSETIISRKEVENQNINSFGWFLFLQYQFSQRWFAGSLYDYSGLPTSGDDVERRISAILSFWPSEFQTIKLQLQKSERNFSTPRSFISVYFQWTFIIGAHGAHKF